MNTRPMLYGKEIANTCGRAACQTGERAFWQSRMTTAGRRAEPVELVDLEQLARDVRRGFGGGEA